MIFPVRKYATDLIIANVETLSHETATFTAFLQTVVSLGAMAPCPSTSTTVNRGISRLANIEHDILCAGHVRYDEQIDV